MLYIFLTLFCSKLMCKIEHLNNLEFIFHYENDFKKNYPLRDFNSGYLSLVSHHNVM